MEVKRMFSKKMMLLILGILLTLTMFSNASQYPNKPITMIIPYSPGGGTDLNGRVLATEAEKHIDQPIVVKNRPGATGTIASTEAAKAKPDGYTILFTPTDPMCTVVHMVDVEYSIEDFRGVMGASFDPSVIAVHTESPYETIEDVIALKDSDKVVNRGHSGIGGIHHIMFEMFFPAAGITNYRDVPFEGGMNAITALRGGHVDIVGGTAGAMVPSIEAGELRLLAVAAAERSPFYPDVPTLKEKGFDDIDVAANFFLLAPKDTPDEVIEVLEEIFIKAAKSEAFTKFAENNNQQIYIRDAEAIYEKVKSDYQKFGEVISSFDK
jgi:tripartite-type tricarboxylate transporter receptor subunit TctC